MIAAYLKENTKPFHDALERKMMVDKIFSGTLTMQDYANILKVNLSVHQIIEPAISQALDNDVKSEIDWDKRHKTPFLIKDIGALQPGSDFGFNLENSDEALGALYVLEGASLGGSVIKKQLGKNPEFINATFSYYGMYGENLAGNWKIFIDILEKKVKDKDAALSGAAKAYKLFLKSADSLL